ncbi:MAG: hypothetical protein IID45_01575 [Planctomycetes bacterium]|nr:hypothetical protein [Planctomycetota bacterium]
MMPMTLALKRGPRTLAITVLLLITGSSQSSFGQERQAKPDAKTADSAGIPHRHTPIEIVARPIVKRFKVALVRPRRLIMGVEGDLFIADWAAGTIFRLSADGTSSLFAGDLNEPAGLAFDGMGYLYVSTHAQGLMKEGKIIKISPDGMKTIFAEGLTGPTGLAFDMQGMLFVANYHDNSIVQVSSSGSVTTFVANVPSPSGLVFDNEGTMFVASSTEGIIYRITSMGEITIHARGLHLPSDLILDRKGNLVVTNFGRGRLSYVSRSGRVSPLAIVPKGTIASLIDRDGNLLIVNWDDHYLMKITTNLFIDCPHCGKKIPIRLVSPRKTIPPRTEQKPPSPPII